MIRSILLSLGVSLALHALLAAALVAYLQYGPKPDTLATLDPSSVEVSFAEKVDESATAAPMPAMPSEKPPLVPKAERPSTPENAKPLPPDPAAPKLRQPTEEPYRFEAEDAERESNKENSRTVEPATHAPRQAKVDAPPRPRRTIRPDYPKGARQRGEQGNVTLEIRVNAKGTVDAASVVSSSGFAELDAAAVKAAKAAKFTPARSGDEAVASVARLTLSFKLR